MLKPAQEAGFLYLPPEPEQVEGDIMKKVAVFGKPANGKSTLSKKLASATGLNLNMTGGRNEAAAGTWLIEWRRVKRDLRAFCL